MARSRRSAPPAATGAPANLAPPPAPRGATGAATGEEGGVQRSLDQVLDIGLAALQQSLLELDAGDLDFDALEVVLETAEQAIALSGEGSAGREAPASPVPDAPHPRGEGAEPELSLEGLVAQLATLERSVTDPLQLTAVDAQAEELSIVLSMLLASDASRAPAWLGERLRANIRSAIATDSRTLWWRTVRALMDVGDQQVLDLIFPLIARTLRFARPPLVEQLVAAAQDTTEIAHEAIWPHAANELLLARRERGDRTPPGLVELVARVPAREERSIDRLGRLQALAGDCVARDAFNPRVRALYPFFARLLKTVHGPRVGPAVVTGLRVAPLEGDWTIALQALRGYRSAHASFLRRVLLEADSRAPSRELLEQAAAAVAASLAELPEEQRGESWIPDAILWLASERSPAVARLATDIRRARKRPFVPAWPVGCRRAAKRALATMRTGGRP